MSGYRNYVPWKSSLPYKTGSSSTYSSRDDVSTADAKSRIGLTASPASFRPSFSGGTYKSARRDAPLIVPLSKNYGSSFSSPNKSEKEVPKATQPASHVATKISVQPSQPKYVGATSSRTLEPNISRYSTSTGNLSKYGRKSRDPSPAVDRMANLSVTRAKSRDPSPLGDRRHNAGAYSTSTSCLSKYGHRSRDPSPANSDARVTAGTQNRSTLRARSRDPSPVNVQYKSTLGTSPGSYASNYRLGQRSSKAYTSKYGNSSSSSSSNTTLPDKALSYMSMSDFRARSVSRSHDCAKKLEKMSLKEPEEAEKPVHESPIVESKQFDKKHVAEEEAQGAAEPEVFISVKVVTRGTSPTPPGVTAIVRTRRLELAKTVEKTIQRTIKRPRCADKEIQSDRLDDTTRYSRFSSASRLSNSTWSPPYSPDQKFTRSDSSKYTSNSNSVSPSSCKSNRNEGETPEKKKKDESKSSSSSRRSSIKQDGSKDSSDSKPMKASKQSSGSSKQRSTDNSATASSRSLPPAIPKAESAPKSASSSSGSSRWPNKDFRKSALNVGPTDRPRKSRTPSTGTDTDEKSDPQKTSPGFARVERSPSAGSEAGSTTSSSNGFGQPLDDAKLDPQGRSAAASSGRDQARENNVFTPEQVPKDYSSSESYNKTFGVRSDGGRRERECDAREFRQVRPAAGAESPMQLVAKNEDAKSLLQKLGSISNFFVTRNHDGSSGETIFLDTTSGSSGPEASISGVPKGDAPTTTATVSHPEVHSHLLNPTAAATSTTTSDQDESSWWQNTSRQIDTESALDLRDDMKYKLRHIDSGEMAWWMRNEEDQDAPNHEDDTLADDWRTLNQQTDLDTDLDRSDRTDRLIANETKRSASRDTTPWWPSNQSDSPLKERSPRVRRAESGEKAWWLDEPSEANLHNSVADPSTDEAGSNRCHYQAQDKDLATQLQPPSPANEALHTNGSLYHNGNHYQSQRLSTVNENAASEFAGSSSEAAGPNTQVTVPRWMADDADRKPAMFKVRRIESGERAWWLSDSNDSSSRSAPAPAAAATASPVLAATAQPTLTLNHIRRIESGERAWWLQDEPSEAQTKAAAAEDDDDEEVKRATENYFSRQSNADLLTDSSHSQVPPLGHRRSPEGLEDTTQIRSSPRNERKSSCASHFVGNNNNHSHIPQATKYRSAKALSAAESLFISRHTNIDELLGRSCRPLSPLLDRFNGCVLGEKADMGLFVEEISPQQVRIHDSTAQMPVIQRMQRDEWDFASENRKYQVVESSAVKNACNLKTSFDILAHGSPSHTYTTLNHNRSRRKMIVKMEPDELISLRVQYLVDTDPFNSLSVYPTPTRAPTYSFPCTIPLGTQLGAILRLLGAPQRLDDAAIQVYKDGDYGAYLDLESSLAEQAEEIEGLDSSRKNSLVVRTQLSVRVHAIIEKLLTSEGSELRRALFSLKQIFQEDKDLVHGFVALGGLNCLVRVGNVADQNYQNYILRALGQVMLYVDGMNGVMKHGPTIQWLYSLIASKYRLVVKTALKLLLVFVEYVETNCMLLVRAVHAVDKAKGTLPWSNIMKLLKDYENADTELLIYATSLINKTLSGLSDQDSFYDESDFLEQQGMEGVIQRYMSRPGTDLDLLDQLQLYEAVLKFEDGETEGIRIPDDSIRKTLRLRNTDSTERRKSRRHSTGASPLQSNVVSPKRYTPPDQEVLDEDSSSSNNSNEFNGGVFRENKGQREGAGVTPGLRRRRERAERQKSFMREQQEALANGFRTPFDANGHQNELGQIVTAVPVHLRNGSDSPPESLILRPEKPQPVVKNNKESSRTSSNLQYSPVKKALSNTSISVISNGFEKKLGSNGVSSASERTPLNTLGQSTGITGKRYSSSSSDLVSKRNLVNRMNSSTVLKGQTMNSDKANIMTRLENTIGSNNAQNNSGYTSHKKFENDSNRLNNYYNHMSSAASARNNNITTSMLNQKNLNLSGSGNCNGVAGANSNSRFTKNNSTNPGALRLNGNYEDSKVSPTANKLGPYHSASPAPSEMLVSPHRVGTAPSSNGSNKSHSSGGVNPSTGDGDVEYEEKKQLQIRRDNTVKDLTQKLKNMPTSPQEEKPPNRIGDMTGLISKAKEGLAKSKSKGDISRSPSVDQEIKKVEPKKSENELHWEELVKNMTRPLMLCDLDFTDLNEEDEKDGLAPRGLGGAVPPPPPPIGIPPPISGMGPPFGGKIPPPHFPPPPTNLVPPPGFGYASLNNRPNGENNNQTIKKNKKTVKLFWKEVREDMIHTKTIWDEMPKATVDVQKLEHLFESRAKDLMTKKQQELNKNKEIIVLDHKRSNAINIAMTKLPPPRAIKAAILKMDQTVVTREGIDKLLNMLPTDEERAKIQEAQMANPELPLGSAEQFLLTLSSISELSARLKLWAFKLDFENTEKEIAEPLNDLKQGLELLKANKTFKCILSTLLSIGEFLNGTVVKGFQIEYLAKVPEVKDTVHKHTLLHHLCHMVMELSPDTTDLYSEIGPVTRASKADFTDLAHNIVYLETECKASWDRLKVIAKHDCPVQLKQKLVDFLADCAERIIILETVHRRVINRYRKFLLWLGVPQHRVVESKPNEFCRIVSEFALEYRTTRERVQQQIEKKANHRERNKTRGKMIIDVGKFRTQEDRADAELKQLLGSPNPRNDNPDGTLTWRRRRAEELRSPIIRQNEESFTDGDDEILESLVKTATKAAGPRPTPRERKRTRHADRKSLRRTLKNGLTEEEKQHVASLIKTY